MSRFRLPGLLRALILYGLLIPCGASIAQPPQAAQDADVLRPENRVAWCIVPFDAANRTPRERAQMLQELGIKRCAYDWREEHVPTFEAEILAYKEHGIEFFAFWGVHDEAFRLFEQYDLHPQVWQMIPQPLGETQQAKVESAAQQLVALAERTKTLDCELGLYNHGGWGGEPANMVAVCKRLHELGHSNVGIVYNFHHGHGHIEDWSTAFASMKPYLLCLNLNGMNDNAEPKILGIGRGEHELGMLRTVVESDYAGPIGILDHRPELDARESLQENMAGLDALREKLLAEQNGSVANVPASAHCEHLNPTAGWQEQSAEAIPYDLAVKDELVAAAQEYGDAARGARVFATAKTACISCHKVGEHGGTVGPELTKLAKERELGHIVESLFWPERDVKDEYRSWSVLTTEGKVLTGFKRGEDNTTLTLQDPASGQLTNINKQDIDEEIEGTTVMPSGLTAAMSRQQTLDLISFLSELGRDGKPLTAELQQAIAMSQHHGPATFPLEAGPLDPARWPNASKRVNRDRVYDFYTKQAEYFRQQPALPMLLAPYAGLDGGQQGHWGNQDENYWADDRWNETKIGRVQAGVFHAGDLTIPRGVCVRIGEQAELSVCFDPQTLTYRAVWSGGFVKFDSIRHGLLGGLLLDGELQPTPQHDAPEQSWEYHGYYRAGNRVIFSYRIGETEYLDSPWFNDGEFVREVAPTDEHPLRDALAAARPQWPQELETRIIPGTQRPYAVDTIELPYDNPWNALLFCGGHDFLPDGSALVSTFQGDVWHVTGLDAPPDQESKATWRRFAAGLHQPLGLHVIDGEIYVQCRDQLMRLSDRNGDGEADFYEVVNDAFVTSPGGHDFVCGLQRDRHGNFYAASSNQGVLRLSPDGQTADVIATGFRNPDGIGILPDGTVTVPVSEGNWTPASAICAIRDADIITPAEAPHFGYGGPRANQPPALPLVYLPRGIDNSSGGQVYVESERFGPLHDQLLHLSFGAGTWMVVLRNEVDGQLQGAAVPMTGDFLSGVHRCRFNPADGQLYVSGMIGWGSYTADDGCFQRVRYTGDHVQLPTGFHVHENGIRVTFAEPVAPSIATDAGQHFAQCWNYRFSGAYGSPEYSTTHPGVAGHDPLVITAAHVLDDNCSVFLEIPDLQPVSQLHLRMHVNADDAFSYNPAGSGHDLFLTVHALDEPFADYPGYAPYKKTIAAHPLLVDLATSDARIANPWLQEIADARRVKIETGSNLTYKTREFSVKAREPIALTLANPDVVPHNWVLVAPGALKKVGALGNQLIARPDAYARQYVPEADEVIAHTDIVSAGEQQTIYFNAPAEPGRYPFLCTFPGHWMVMNGIMVVE